MKRYFGLLFSILTLSSASQNLAKDELLGAWQFQGKDITHQMTWTDGYFVVTTYNEDQFIGTYGGAWNLNNDWLVMTIEFHTETPDQVGKIWNRKLEIKDDGELVYDDKSWRRTDNGQPGNLQGAWHITGRMRNGEMRERQPGPRITMKILSGTRFQWIAYNTETAEFFGTGGGTYTSVDGEYIENIEFFSRDQSRVGASLSFSFELKEGKWHHSGKSSKGADIYEVWSLR